MLKFIPFTPLYRGQPQGLPLLVFIFFNILLMPMFLPIAQANEAPARVYHVCIQLAAQGKISEAIAALQASSALLSPIDSWKQRMLAAASLLQLKQQQSTQLPDPQGNSNLMLATVFTKQHPVPVSVNPWLVGGLGMVLPGAGHAFLGRWHDAKVAFLMVFPMLILTLWAWKRSMGPVTVFFALITAWLWSGSIFSAISLSERGNMEAYMHWWKPLWQAAALSGQPW
ncbi:MAG: hypothetical protein COA61_000110 [Zetaproteobacteria bacterium]|nr:hypothetical protein [Zetaproteobacteria bacterium]